MKETDVMQLRRHHHQAIEYINCRVFLHVSTDTKGIKVNQETPELLLKMKWHSFLWLLV